MQVLKWLVGALALLAVACGEVSETSTPVIRDGEGLLELPLVSTSAGRSYKLVGATFVITGPQNATITDTSAASVMLPLMAGAYSIQMNGDWHVERTDAPGVTVPATLVSPNPMSFALNEGETRPVRFLFKVPGDATVDVGIGVDSGGWISGTLQLGSRPPPPVGVPDVFAEVAGKSISFVISYESATVTRSNEYGYKRVNVETSPVTFQVEGAAGEVFQQQFVAALQGRLMNFVLSTDGSSRVIGGPILLANMERGLWLELAPMVTTFGVDADGYPRIQTAAIEGYGNLNASGVPSLNGELTHGTLSPQ